MDASALSELIKAKVAALIQEHLKPVVSELAAQHQMLQTHSALLRYNHNVNDYQMGRLENLRDLEQSINFKVAGVLAFDPWQHPTTGTNLREPVPADPNLIPRFTPESKTPVQRATESAELIAQAGVSARRLGVPLTLHDFPRDPAIHCGGENEDPMHAAVPLFGLRAPRWRAKEGLPPDTTPGTATYNGISAPPTGKKGKKLYRKRAQKMKPKWKSFEAATAPRGPPSTSSPFDKLFELLDGPALAGPSGSSGTAATGREASTSGVTPTPGSPGQESPTTNLTNSDIAHAAASSEKTSQPDSQHNEQIRPVTPTAPAFTATTVPPPVPTPPSLKRTRRDAELDEEDDGGAGGSNSHGAVPPTKTNPEPQPPIKQEPEEPEHQSQRPPKRRRRSAAPSPSPSIGGLGLETRGGWPGPGLGQLRRSSRVARAHAHAHAHATAAPAPATRKRRQNGKRAPTKSRS